MAFGTPLKLIDVKIIAGTARSNQRSGARVATKTGTLLPLSDTKTDNRGEVAHDNYNETIITNYHFNISTIMFYKLVNCVTLLICNTY